MANLKLGRLPDRTPVKISFQAHPDLAGALRAYAELYRETYGQAASVSDLIPCMLESFLASDRAFVQAAFVQARRERRVGANAASADEASRPEQPRNADLFAPAAGRR